ncbi:GntR family transcriptional regulator [Hoyosella subflava]|uniref:GntR family transcriptional regulator n=1 Tax=Hoyosella subflava (strain DSM 45089 / JCM 17490 / NBRC 109087 / DQS3-9A1) TaxID=443218 RepID=F6EKY3_HOYSD|nr:GntR family transcriptional regulator [Hoyosella subflava]AEF41463.1 GntR family transcriptional regulator [Hoyosella subflava DQS3-9A1]
MAAPDGMLLFEERPTAQLIADHLREQIVEGVFRPGQQLNESVLAGRLRTSRGPLREALQRLSQEGILVSMRNRGVFVPELSLDDIKEIYSVREAVESASAKSLIVKDEDQLRETRQALQETISEMGRHVAASDWRACTKMDMQFHVLFVAGAGNSRLSRIYETLVAESRMCMLSLECSYPRLGVLVQEHQKLLNLLEARDAEGLQSAISRHMHGAVEDLMQNATDGVTEGVSAT